MPAQVSPVHVRAVVGSANIPATIAKNLALLWSVLSDVGVDVTKTAAYWNTIASSKQNHYFTQSSFTTVITYGDLVLSAYVESLQCMRI